MHPALLLWSIAACIQLCRSHALNHNLNMLLYVSPHPLGVSSRHMTSATYRYVHPQCQEIDSQNRKLVVNARICEPVRNAMARGGAARRRRLYLHNTLDNNSPFKGCLDRERYLRLNRRQTGSKRSRRSNCRIVVSNYLVECRFLYTTHHVSGIRCKPFESLPLGGGCVVVSWATEVLPLPSLVLRKSTMLNNDKIKKILFEAELLFV